MANFSTDRGFRPFRLQTLTGLRWLAIAGQTLCVLGISLVFGFAVPLWACLGLIGLSVIVNLILSVRFGAAYRLTSGFAAQQLAFDSVQLGGLLWLTGGLENPFSILLLAPVSVSATMLGRGATGALALLAGLIASLLALNHWPLPWSPGQKAALESTYVLGLWVALLCGVAFIATYINRVAHEARQLADALAATELALSAQQQLSALDGLAAAAAHELGTPLSTIALAAKELRLEPGTAETEADLDLILEQIARCRAILGKLRNLGAEKGDPFKTVALRDLIREAARPHEGRAIKVTIIAGSNEGTEPIIERNVGLLYGLGNLIENAVRYARTKVEIRADWDRDGIILTIRDDGPGFAPELIAELGEPYLTGGLGAPAEIAEDGGLGLGIFIAKTLLARTGARLSFGNSVQGGHAEVVVRWPAGAEQF